jgi:hypothetical protein
VKSGLPWPNPELGMRTGSASNAANEFLLGM